MLNSYQLLSSDIVDGYLTNNKGMVAQRGLETRECPSKWPWLWVGFTQCCAYARSSVEKLAAISTTTASPRVFLLQFFFVHMLYARRVCSLTHVSFIKYDRHTHTTSSDDILSCTAVSSVSHAISDQKWQYSQRISTAEKICKPQLHQNIKVACHCYRLQSAQKAIS